MWRELIVALSADVHPIGELDPGPDFFPGATSEQLNTVERTLAIHMPSPLRELLEESNGVFVVFGQHFIWSTDELLRYNVQYNQPPWVEPHDQRRHDNPDKRRLFFFGDAGVDGILFGFPIMADNTLGEQVYAWYPIGDEQVEKAPSLRDYVVDWLSGRLTV
jgi:hypothetical protein